MDNYTNKKELSEEDIAKLSRIIIPLGELEIVPREK
jgi:hypothetical protein